MLTKRDRRNAVKAALSKTGNQAGDKWTDARPSAYDRPTANTEWWRVYWTARLLLNPEDGEARMYQ